MGLVVVGGGASTLLAACSSEGKPTAATGTTAAGGSGATPDLGTLDHQFSWIKNTAFAGAYIADTNGYYADAGFSKVNLMAGGPSVIQDQIVDSGGAFVGISAPDITAAGIVNNGNRLVAVGALFQKNAFCIMSLASNPLPNPQSMIGKKIGVQSVNEPVWNAFLTANNINPSDITLVPAQFDPQPLTTGEVDGWFSFITNEPNLLKVQGVDTVTFLLNDFKYPLVSQIYIVQTDTLTNERDKLKAFLKAEIMGWHASLQDPTLGPHLVVTKYGSDLGLDEDEQVLASKAQGKLILDDRTKTEGILTVSPEQITENITTLAVSGIDIKAEQLFDLSVLAEVYEENPSLKTVAL